jgi:hypothetical protein
MGHINAICKILSHLLGMKVCTYREDRYINSICKSVGPLFINICTCRGHKTNYRHLSDTAVTTFDYSITNVLLFYG